ncbi:hypothetical protein HQ585_08910 [candidate division KSB1 bacterium]|nr:hypothetical protein [candidate division KSB1 bacterium]
MRVVRSIIPFIIIAFTCLTVIIPAFSATGVPVIIKAKRVDNGVVIPSESTLQLNSNEMIAIDYTFEMHNHESYTLEIPIKSIYKPEPPYISGWKDDTVYVAAGDTAILEKRVFVQPYPEHIGYPYTRFFVQVHHPKFWWVHRLYLDIQESGFSVPRLMTEPEFSSGTSNSVEWIPAEGNSIIYQDAYAYDINNPENLILSLKEQFGVQYDDTMRTTFAGLEDGHTYGYYVKTKHDRPQGPLSLYSRFRFSRQDRLPPPAIQEPLALETDQGVELSWVSVEDTVSGVDKYRIYRAMDTNIEAIHDSVLVDDPDVLSYAWIDTEVDSGVTYYYRVRGIDVAGNIGMGDRSNAIRFGDQADIPDIPEDPLGDEDIFQQTQNPQGFIRGALDTIIVEIPEQVQRIRFEAVRDDLEFFDNPPSGNGRYFDGGWVERPFPPYWVFDYQFTGLLTVDETGIAQYGTDGIQLDANFVNGHTYFRRVTFDYGTTTRRDTAEVIPDCFPPDDIRNLQIQTWITDPPQNDLPGGYTSWMARLTWEAAEDAVSGLQRYHIFRKVEDVDESFIEIPLPESFTDISYEEVYTPSGDQFVNPVIAYKITSDDQIGNVRNLNQTTWEVSDRVLNAPRLSFELNSPNLIPISEDTAFSRASNVPIEIQRFDKEAVDHYIIAVNDDEIERSNEGQDTLLVALPDIEVVRIKVRAIYHAERSSVWSNENTIIRTRSKAPSGLTAENDPDSWFGHLYLSWQKPSLDAAFYEIWRDSTLIGVDSSQIQQIEWIDDYGIDELTGESTTPLTAYKSYHYQIRKINIFGDATTFSSPASAICNRPSQVVSQDPPQMEDNNYVLCIHWERALPSLVESGFQSLVAVYQDSLDSLITIDPVADDDTSYCFRNALVGHNYIFRIQEIPNDSRFGPSPWSRPYTVSSLVQYEPFVVLPQPNGHIYVDWANPAIVETYKIETFQICRDTICWLFPNTTFSMMDPAAHLNHGQNYTYTIFGLDSLDQVVAANTKIVTSDTGAVFIPEIDPFTFRYFNSDSISVSWTWRDIQGIALSDDTRGAVQCLIQASVSHDFPVTPEQTTTTGFFPVTSGTRSQKVEVPILLNRENEKVYFRVTAEDAWGHPVSTAWSTEFYTMKQSIFDPVPPRSVQDLSSDNAQAWYAVSDTVMLDLQWTGTGVEQPVPDSQELWDPSIGNVAFYRVIRKLDNGGEVQLAQIPVQSELPTYTILDTIANQSTEWKIISVDSAGNTTTSEWISNTGLVPTPEPPQPVQLRGCDIVKNSDDPPGLEYYIEIAMNSDHFSYAYEIGDGDQMDRFLCQSGWIMETSFACTTGWGAIELDTTWFRVKARKLWGSSIWESGWSEIVSYTPSGDGNPQKPADSDIALPESFSVSPNYPNPFNGETRFEYALPKPADVEIHIYNIHGEEVRNIRRSAQSAGYQSLTWNGCNNAGQLTASGIYLALIRMHADDGEVFQKRLKMTMLK